MSSDTDDARHYAHRLESGEAWQELCRALERASERVLGEGVPDSPRHRAEGFRYLCRFLGAGLVSSVLHNDPDHPVFGRMMDYTMPWGLDHPDCLYLYAPLRDGATYRVWGQRGSANVFDLQVNAGHFSDGEVAAVRTLSSIDDTNLLTGPGGSFELFVGGEPRDGNWLPTGPGVEFMLVRQYFADWERERPADLLIERLGAEYPMPPPSPERVGRQLEKLSRWLDRGGRQWETMSRGFLSLPENTLLMHRADAASQHGGTRGQSYGIGNFHCGPDEAVVIEFEPPQRGRHWVVALANEFWEHVEFGTRQSSLNAHQAALDSDGRFRGVIAHADPGVPNWLDPGHNERGTLAIRFVDADRLPEISLARVPLTRLGAALPADTPKVDPGERRRRLVDRHHAVLRRYRR